MYHVYTSISVVMSDSNFRNMMPHGGIVKQWRMWSIFKVKDGSDVSATATEELKAFDAAAMVEREDKPVTLVLEQTNMGRGQTW